MNEFKFFISGESATTRKICADLDAFLAEAFDGQYTLKIIDVIKNPRMAIEDGVLATPTLAKMNPPVKRILGDFGDIPGVFQKMGVDLPSKMSGTTDEG